MLNEPSKVNWTFSFNVNEVNHVQKEINNAENGALKVLRINPSFLENHTIKEIPQLFDGENVPEWFTNDIAYWWGNYMTNEEINETLPDWTRKMTHLELDLWTDCCMLCPHCFKSQIDAHKLKEWTQFSLQEVKWKITQFKKIGLKTIKITWAWEPFYNKDIIDFLEWAQKNDIGVALFTKWYEIWDDSMVERLFGQKYGIHNSEQMAKKLKELDVSILLGVNTFDPELQKSFVGHGDSKFWERYIQARDNALIQLINAGLNEFTPGKPTRLGISMAPIKPETLDEIIDLYSRARMRNIYPLWCPSNDAWDWKKENIRVDSITNNYENDLINLYTKIYIRNIEHNVQTLEQFLEEWPSLYPGVAVCQQACTWWYMRLSDDHLKYEMISCAGHDPARKELKIAEDLMALETDTQVLEAWANSVNAKRWKYHCIARDWITLSPNFYAKITDQVKRYFNIQ